MEFNSIDFLFFFPTVVFVFFIIPKKLRVIWLLITSYYFYMCWNPKYALLIALSTLITYISSIFIEKSKNKVRKKWWIFGSLICNLGILIIFKYANFILNSLNYLSIHLGFFTIEYKLDLLLPVGISFYTFQAIGYTLDVYRGNIKAEKNILKYALFVSFFPQLVAGPIERSQNLLTQIQNIKNIKLWNYDRVKDGFFLMMWGLFQKIVLADRASLLVKNVINNYKNYGFIELSIAMILFAFQIYCDFGGYTNIAKGSARIMGFDLMNNFRQPYFATSIKDFWHRWHISLTTWFTDYLYIPLGGNRKKLSRKYINILIVFFVSGLWHGANWSFVVWGLIHAFYQIAEDFINKTFKKRVLSETYFIRCARMLYTFILVDISWIFFVSSDCNHAINIIKQMFSVFYTSNIFTLGLNKIDWFLLIYSISILIIVDILHEKGIKISNYIRKQKFWFRWLLYIMLIISIIMFGIYGISYDTSTFIYFQF